MRIEIEPRLRKAVALAQLRINENKQTEDVVTIQRFESSFVHPKTAGLSCASLPR